MAAIFFAEQTEEEAYQTYVDNASTNWHFYPIQREMMAFMSRLFKGCGKEITDNTAFCTECGTPTPARAATPLPTYTQSNYSEQSSKGRYSVVGTGCFFGMIFQYTIPVLGWLICFIIAFASKNENKNHFAKARMIWLFIGIVLSDVGYFVFRRLGGMLTDYNNAEFCGQFGDLKKLSEQFKQFEKGGLMPPIN